VQRHDQGPSPFAWLVAFISVVLPWAASIIAVMGLWQVARGEQGGWWFVAAAGGLLVADILIDFVWAHPSVLKTDQPDLNQRPAQLLGRIATVEEAIAYGRGRVRIGDTLWLAEGPDMPAGSEVRVTAANGAVLRVERV
jgi:membrane protein implicated in regulation of membrane protease activity